MAKNIRADESILNPATPQSRSLRTTIPAFIVSQFELKKGDKLRWFIEDGFLVVQIQKEEETL
jgi:antitoxin component of MazEF toxin-antitoxin module